MGNEMILSHLSSSHVRGNDLTTNSPFDVPASNIVALTRVFVEQNYAKRDIRRVFERSQRDLSMSSGKEGGERVDQSDLVMFCPARSSAQAVLLWR